MTNAETGISARLIVAPDSGVRPQVSLVMVVLDATTVSACLTSILAQGIDPARVEIVVTSVSGGDADQLAEVLADFASSHPAYRVRRVRVDPAYVGEARAVGLGAARGTMHVVVDASVLLAPGLLALLLDGREPRIGPGLGPRLELVRGLLAVASADPAILARRDEALAEHVAWIGKYVDEDPARHAALVDQARARRVHDLPWAEINRGRARDLAILYSFVPFIDTSGLVAARRLREAGVVTDVISQDMANVRRNDPLSLRIPAEVLDEQRILAGKRHLVRWRAVRRFTEDALAAVGELEAAKGPYRSVYSRAMIYHSHFPAALLKVRRPALRWTAEFSDPLSYNAYGEQRVADVEDDWLLEELGAGFRSAGFGIPTSRAGFAWAELIAYAFADEVIFTNAHQRDLMIGYCEDPALAQRAASIATVLHHPVPDPELYELAAPTYRLDPARIHVGYFGNFYANRGLVEVLDALVALDVTVRNRLALHVFTSKPAALVALVEERGLHGVVHANEMLGYLEYLNLSTRFDVLLINDYATSPHFVPNPYLPAKLADYRGSGARIWALFEDGSILADSAVDFATPLGDLAGAVAVLKELSAGAFDRADAGARIRSLGAG